MVSNQSTDSIIAQQITEHNDNLELYLSQIGRIFDIPRIINEPQGKQQITDYYVKGKFGFLLFFSAEGFITTGLVMTGNIKRRILKSKQELLRSTSVIVTAKTYWNLHVGWVVTWHFLRAGILALCSKELI